MPWLGQRGFGLAHQGGERSRFIGGDVGEHLAVQVDAGAPEPADELRVADAIVAAAGVDADDEQAAELALLAAATDIRVTEGLFDGLLGCAVQLALIEEIPFGESKGFAP